MACPSGVLAVNATAVSRASAVNLDLLPWPKVSCCARSRILVERSAYDRFAELLIGLPAASASETPPNDATEWARSSPRSIASRWRVRRRRAALLR